MSDLIDRQTVLRCIKESRDNIDWGQSEDGDAFLHYTGALYRTIASEECVPSAEPEIIRCKDCEYFRTPKDENNYCDHDFAGIRHVPFDDDYCSYAERREEE